METHTLQTIVEGGRKEEDKQTNEEEDMQGREAVGWMEYTGGLYFEELERARDIEYTSYVHI